MRVCVSRKKSFRAGRAARLLCAALAACTLSCAAPVGSGWAEPPQPPTIGGGDGENLSIAISSGLYEEQGPLVRQDAIGIVGAPMPFVMQLTDNGEHRLFIFIQHRLPGGPYCAETPAQLEDVSTELTAPEGDPTIPGPGYSKPYLWTPTEVGDYAFCAYLDASPAARPAEINFLKLSADPAPGHLTFSVIPETGRSQRVSVQVHGEAVLPSQVTTSVQEQGQPCTLPGGGLAGQLLQEAEGSAASAPGAVELGLFNSSYTFTAPRPGAYEACAYLTPAPYFSRPYEVGSADFLVQDELMGSGQDFPTPAAREAPPALHHVSVTNSRFRAALSRARYANRPPVGTTFRFAVSEPATVRIAMTRLLPGALRGGRCAPLRARTVESHLPRCNRSLAVGSIVHSSAVAGNDAIRFSGVIAHRKLAAGFYTAAVTAHNAYGHSRSVRLRFSILP